MTWLYAADRLVEFPLGVFSIALATVILPSLSAHHARSSPDEFSATLSWAIRLVCLIVVPASVALFVLAGPLTVAIYHRGKFSEFDVEMTRIALMAFSFALLGWSLIKVLAPGYYARQNTKGPVKVAMRALALTMALNVIAIGTLFALDRRELPGMHALLALTNGIGALFNAGWLYLGLRRDNVLYGDRTNRRMLFRIVVASGVMAAFLWWFGGSVQEWLSIPDARRIVWMSWLVAGGAGLYFACLWVLGARGRDFRLRPPTRPA
jgi:putative peptidoglycan lipid II flippase